MRDSLETNVTAVNKPYDTDFDELDILDNIEDQELKDKLLQTYNRKSEYLGIGDQFFTYNSHYDYKEVIIGEVTGTNNYRVKESYYFTDDYCLKFESNRGYEDRQELDFDISLNEYAKIIRDNKSEFNTSYYIPYDEDVVTCLIEDVLKYNSMNVILSEYVSDKDDLDNIIDFMNANSEFIDRYFERLEDQNLVDTMTIMEDIGDIEAVYGVEMEERDIKVKMLIPGTLNKYLVMF